MKKFKKSMIDFIFNRPKTSIAISCSLFSFFLPFILTLKTNFTHRAWYTEDHPIAIQVDLLEKEFGNDETAVIVMHSNSNILTKENLLAVERITNELGMIRNIYSVETILNFNSIKSTDDDINIAPFFETQLLNEPGYLAHKIQDVEKDQILKGYLVSEDLKTMLIIATLVSTKEHKVNYTILNEKLEALLAAEKGVSEGTSFHLLGRVAINAALKDVGFGDTKTLLPLLFVMIILFLIFFFKDFFSVLMPSLVTLFSIGSTMGFAGMIQMEMVSISFIIPIILVAISIADSVHIVDVFHKKMRTLSHKDALLFSAKKNFTPTILTSLTTATGFISLIISDLIPIKMFGLISALGVVLAWFFSYFLLVPALSLVRVKKRQRIETHISDKSRSYLHFLIKYKGLILFSFSGITGLLLFNALSLKIDTNPFENFKEDHKLRVSNDIMLEGFGGVTGPEIVINADSNLGVKDVAFLKTVDAFTKKLLEDKSINNISSPLITIKTMNKSLNGDDDKYYTIPEDEKSIAQLILLYNISVSPEKSLFNFITNDYKKMRLSVFWNNQSAVEGLKKSQEIEALGRKYNLDLVVTGKVNAQQKMVNFVITTFLQSIAISFVIVSIILALYFKSAFLGLLSMLPNITPLAFASGILVVMNQSVDFTVAVVSSICLGIAVDDTIHFLASYLKAKRSGLNTEDSLYEVLKGSAGSLILTTIILMVGFGVFAFSDFVPNRNFGLLSSGVLFVALLTDLLLLPVILLYLDKIKTALIKGR